MRLDLDALKAEASRMTYERARAEAMGFRFEDIDVKRAHGVGVQLTGTLICVCGRRERFSEGFVFDDGRVHVWDMMRYLLERMNIARAMGRAGAFTREHLLQDGYTPEQVDEIESKGRRFDQECRERLWSSDVR